MLGLVTSCNLAQELEYSEAEDVVLTFPVAYANSSIESRRMVESDNQIRNIDLLIFDESKKFLQRIQVNNIFSDGTSSTFKVRLAESNKPRTIHVIANGRDENNTDIVNFSSITAGLNEEASISLLHTHGMTSAKALKTPLLMSGKVEVSSVHSNTTVGVVNLIRSVASIYVQCDPNLANTGDFVLSGFSLLKSAERGQVITKNSSIVNLPTNLKFIDFTDANGNGIWAKEIANALHTDVLYIYERTNILDNSGLSIIVAGKYKGVECYYKIWLQDESGKARNIVRNQCYQVQLSKITGTGYTSLSEAISATHPANIHATIIDNNDDITDIVVNGKYALGTSSNVVSISGSGAKVIGTVLSTNPETTVKVTSLADWVTNPRLEGSGMRQTLSVDLQPSSITRKGVIVLRAGSLERRIEVTQLASGSR